jgi:hypothetical protein
LSAKGDLLIALCKSRAKLATCLLGWTKENREKLINEKEKKQGAKK